MPENREALPRQSNSEIRPTAAQMALLASMPINLVRKGGWLLLPDGVDGQDIADLRALGLVTMEGQGRGSRRWVRTPAGNAIRGAR